MVGRAGGALTRARRATRAKPPARYRARTQENCIRIRMTCITHTGFPLVCVIRVYRKTCITTVYVYRPVFMCLPGRGAGQRPREEMFCLPHPQLLLCSVTVL